MADPTTVVVVTGTGTDVGKTWVSSRLLETWASSGIICCARKPAQSFSPGDERTDADELASATGERPTLVCPQHRNYETPMAPPMAADVLGRDRILLEELVEEVNRSWGPDRCAIGLVELAGGVRSPLAHDGDGADMITALSPDVVLLVADAGLGTINAVNSALDSLAAATWGAGTRGDGTTRDTTSGDRTGGDGARVLVHLNRYDDTDDLHRRNRDWLAGAGAATVTTDVPRLAELLREPGARPA